MNLSTDDRGALMIRLVNHHVNILRNNHSVIADILIDGHPGYDKMSDECLLETAIKQNISLSGLEIVETIESARRH